MTISMFQCLLIGLWTAFCLAGMLFGIYTNRCLVMAAGVGLILGDLPTGLAMGAVGELAFMGFGVSQGGSVPPNPMGPGIVGTIIAITMKDSGIDVGSALALSFPFAVAFQFVITATYTFATTLTSYAYKALDKKNFRGFRIAANATVCVFAVVGFIIGFGGAFSSEGLQKVISLIPAWLSAGLGVAGKMLPRHWLCHDSQCNGKEGTDSLCTVWLYRHCLPEPSCHGSGCYRYGHCAACIFPCRQRKRRICRRSGG